MLRIMVSRSRLKSVLTGLALYAIAAAMIGYFGVNAYTGKYGLNAQQELDQEIVSLTSELDYVNPHDLVRLSPAPSNPN
jgi:cell division protein FtsB